MSIMRAGCAFVAEAGLSVATATQQLTSYAPTATRRGRAENSCGRCSLNLQACHRKMTAELNTRKSRRLQTVNGTR
jgi:hypothetical protein